MEISEEINFVIRAIIGVTIWSLIFRAINNLSKPNITHTTADVELWDEESNPEMTKGEKSDNSLMNSGEEKKEMQKNQFTSKNYHDLISVNRVFEKN